MIYDKQIYNDDHLKSSIIGFYRMGATISEMVGASGLYYLVITKIIKEYNKNNPVAAIEN